MKTKNMSLKEAYTFVKSKRPIISPNLHFMGQLLEYQKQLCCLTLDCLPEGCAPITSSDHTMTKTTTPEQSNICFPMGTHSSSNASETTLSSCSDYQQFAREANTISMLTSRLQHASVVSDHRPNRVGKTLSLDTSMKYTSGSTLSVPLPTKIRRPSREGLKLYLSSSSQRTQSSPQLSPCSLEARAAYSPLTISNSPSTPTTCT